MMFATQLIGGVVRGDLDGVTGLAALGAAPAALVLDVGLAVAGAVRAEAAAWTARLRQGVSWLRRAAAGALRAVAKVLDPLPVQVPAVEVRDVVWPVLYRVELPVVEVPTPVEAAPVLAMPSAAQVTAEEAPVAVEEAPAPAAEYGPVTCREEAEEALARWDTVRAAARACGIAESTLRSRCRKWGVPLPGRKAKG
jgi:hypothetical protein